jgi:hypothetical protein
VGDFGGRPNTRVLGAGRILDSSNPSELDFTAGSAADRVSLMGVARRVNQSNTRSRYASFVALDR